MMPWSGLSQTSVKHAYEMGTSELHRTSIMLAAIALTTNRSKYPKDLSQRLCEKAGRTRRPKSTALADHSVCAKSLDRSGPVTEVLTLIGIYNVGAGNEGLIRALKKADVTDEIITIGHNLSARTKQYLLEGSMDIVMHQNMRLAASQAVTAMIAHLENRPFVADILPVEVITRENIAGITFG